MYLTFLGGVGTVTGSRFLLEAAGRRVLIDCGLFQGLKQLRLRNWDRFPIRPSDIDAIVLTHAHLDHAGYLPVLVRNGFKGPVFCTSATRDLCEILLLDSGRLQERDAEFANRHGFSKHRPALPLYTEEEARTSLDLLVAKEFDKPFAIAPALGVRFCPAGHILGAAWIEITAGKRTLVFSGDLGRPNSSTMVDPAMVRKADYVVVESTYGDRIHAAVDPEDVLQEAVTRTTQRGGVVLVPTFAVGRAQTILYHLYRLKRAGRIPDLPVFLDSPMAIDASRVFRNHSSAHRLTPEDCKGLCAVARYVTSAEASQALDGNHVPKIILAASGMATGGRVLHHLKVFAPDPRTTILFAGFQAAGTRGAAMVAGARSVKIHGNYVPVRAEVKNLDMLSAHADRDEVLAWLRTIDTPPRLTFVTHGEPVAADALRLAIEEQLKWRCHVPEYRERIHLTEHSTRNSVIG